MWLPTADLWNASSVVRLIGWFIGARARSRTHRQTSGSSGKVGANSFQRYYYIFTLYRRITVTEIKSINESAIEQNTYKQWQPAIPLLRLLRIALIAGMRRQLAVAICRRRRRIFFFFSKRFSTERWYWCWRHTRARLHEMPQYSLWAQELCARIRAGSYRTCSHVRRPHLWLINCALRIFTHDKKKKKKTESDAKLKSRAASRVFVLALLLSDLGLCVCFFLVYFSSSRQSDETCFKRH